MPWPKGRPFSAEHRAKLLRTLDPAAGGWAMRGVPKSAVHRRKMLEPKTKTPLPTLHPTTADLHWAAGFLDGEGSFATIPVKHRDGIGVSHSARVFASQLYPESLQKLATLFGGSIYFREGRGNLLSKKGIWTWSVHGGMARGLMMTLYILLSPYRRQQIRASLIVA